MKKFNQHRIELLLGALLMVSIAGCKKFVEIDPPPTQLVTASVFNNTATATSAQFTIYQAMSSGDSYNVAFYSGLLSDELKVYGSNSFKITLYQNAMGTSPSSGTFNEWNNPYKYIYQANAIIAAMQNNKSISESIANQLTGESKFIRAYWHFYLTNIFGDVPLALTTDYTVTGKLARVPRLQVLKQVIADLMDAQSLLNNNYLDATDTVSTTERVRPNKAAATAMLARAYLYLGDYGKDPTQYLNAEAQASSVINNSLYSLVAITPNTSNVFAKNSNEAIWQLQIPLPSSTSATPDGNKFILISAPSISAISSQLYSSFEPNDLRQANWIGTYQTTTTPVVKYYYPYKYKVRTATSVTEYTMVLRLGEQYLIRAEARAQQGSTSGALSDLNVIRNRAGLPNYSGATDKTSLLNAILHERQVELFCEWGHRWFDLNRTGAVDVVLGPPGNVCASKGGVWSTDGHQKLAPIPLTEIQADPNLIQNPGY